MIIKKSTAKGFRYIDSETGRFAPKSEYFQSIWNNEPNSAPATIIPYWELASYTKENLTNQKITFIDGRKKLIFNNADQFKSFARDYIREKNDNNMNTKKRGGKVDKYAVIDVTYDREGNPTYQTYQINGESLSERLGM